MLRNSRALKSSKGPTAGYAREMVPPRFAVLADGVSGRKAVA